MRKKKRNRLILLAILIGIGIYTIILSNVDRFVNVGGDWNTITIQVLDYLPSLIGLALGLTILIKDKGRGSSTPMRIMLITGLLGVCFSGLFYEMYIDNIWLDEIITATFTITDFQLVIVLCSLIFGIILGLIKR